MEINYIAIGKRIRQLRIERGWSQAMLAEKSGVEPSNISHIERAATKLSLPTLVNISNALEVTLDEIVYESLIKNDHITCDIINQLLADCTSNEISAIIEIVKTTKNILRNDKNK
ncbi:MAG: helix-turn-helix transcriptional regulator [Clostridia bacterium]|nr:helix-turn-helix transcriptional regulator [Clostridia bacterium]